MEEISNLGTRWNATADFDLPKLACIATNNNNQNNDDYVSNFSALGYINEQNNNFGIDYKNIYIRLLLDENGNKYNHSGALGNEYVVYGILLQIERLVFDNQSSNNYYG